ncbi:MAG: amino acid permease, partial [Gemmatimonadetes bacterium]|nr:amino acid permease [Gemmatimonadota bacterium]
MVGGGIFAVLGTAVGLARGGTPIAFGIAGLLALLTSYSYAKLSVRYPNAGGTIVFLDRAFGIDLLTGSLNLALWLSYLVTIALYAAAFGSYALTFFPEPSPVWRHVLVSAAIVLPAAINVFNSDIVSESETVIVVLKLALLAVVIGAGAGSIDPSRLAPAAWAGPGQLVVAGMVIFVAYEGFELIANSAADVRHPTVTLPRAFFGCVAFVIVLYLLVAIVTVGSIDGETIARAKDYALAAAAKPALGQAGFVLVSVSALLATFSAVNATIYGNARLGFTLAKDGELPAELGRRVWNRPLGGVTLTAALSLLLANTVNLQSIAILGSASFLLLFAFVNAAGWKLAGEIRARRPICGIACLACFGALLALLAHTFRESPRDLLVFGGMLLGAVGFEWTYARVTGRRFTGLRAE